LNYRVHAVIESFGNKHPMQRHAGMNRSTCPVKKAQFGNGVRPMLCPNKLPYRRVRGKHLTIPQSDNKGP